MEKDMEYRTLVNELTQGLELTKQLKVHLNSVETRDMLIQRIISSYERALLVLKWHRPSSLGQPQPVSPTTTTALLPEASIFANESPQTGEVNKCYADHVGQREGSSKKRKAMPTWTEQVRVSSDNGLDGPIDDGYSWRKYGQKDILGAKYPRSYYRCTYRDMHNCWATKQVQRSDDDSTIFDITYRGKHSCNLHGSNGDPPRASPGKEEVKPINNHQWQQPNELLLNLSTNLKVNTTNLDNGEMIFSPFTFPSTSSEWTMKSGDQNFPYSASTGDNLLGSFSSPFISPATSETSYFSVSPCQMDSNGGINNFLHSESDLTEMISANTSATNSPIMDWDFLNFPADWETKFPFNTPGFFN